MRRLASSPAYFFPGVTMNGEAETGAVFLSALGLRISLLDFF